MQLLFNNYISVDVNTRQLTTDNNEVDNMFLMEVGGVAMRVDLIIVGGDQVIVSMSMPTISSYTTEY